MLRLLLFARHRARIALCGSRERLVDFVSLATLGAIREHARFAVATELLWTQAEGVRETDGIACGKSVEIQASRDPNRVLLRELPQCGS